ncbi:MAG: O-methyltransferase [Bilifractor sp.]
MIVDERMITFINALDHGYTPFLEELQKKARNEGVPIIRREMQSFLKVFLEIQKPEKILEVGTAVGFSTIFMAVYGRKNCRITTIENDQRRILSARENFRRSGYQDQITLLEGDAMEVLQTLADPFDFIFMDAAKGQYIHFLPEILRLMRPGSVLISDNVLQDGDIIESHYVVERRKRTIYKRMRAYLRALKDDPGLDTSIVPLGDGISISIMKE